MVASANIGAPAGSADATTADATTADATTADATTADATTADPGATVLTSRSRPPGPEERSS